MTRQLPARASRRGVLGGLAVAATAAGCDLGTGTSEPSADPAPSTRTSSAPEPAADPDEELVRRVVDDLAGALAVVAGAARSGRPLARELAPWRTLHAAHLEALEAPARVRPARGVTGRPPALRTRVRREETGLQRRLAAASVAAESGALAALLATMSAAVAQQLAADSSGGGA